MWNQLGLALFAALLLGLRHATDPDHLTAVSTLVVSELTGGARRASALGLAWGGGHATTLVLLGLPVVLLGGAVPEAVERAAEVAVGAVIVALAVRLLVRWWRGYLEAHVHDRGGVRQAYGVGLVHGVGGSAAVGIVLVGGVADGAGAVAALLTFAAAVALSMALVSAAFGHALAHEPVLRRLGSMVPALGALSLLFGVWYALAALDALPGALRSIG